MDQIWNCDSENNDFFLSNLQNSRNLTITQRNDNCFIKGLN